MSGGNPIHMRMVEPQMMHTRLVKVTATTIAELVRHRVVGSAGEPNSRNAAWSTLATMTRG